MQACRVLAGDLYGLSGIDSGHIRRGLIMAVEYVCEYCGHAGRVYGLVISADEVLCRDCGELVVPLEPNSGIVDGDD